MQYSDVAKNNGMALPQYAGMKRLNAARIALKHHSILPSRMALDEAVAVVRLFFEEATPTVFGVPFESISLFDFISGDGRGTP